MKRESVVRIARTKGSLSAWLSSGTDFAWASLVIQPVTSCFHHQETSLSCSGVSRPTIHFRGSSLFLRCSKWTRPALRRRAQTFGCDGTIVRTAIYFLSIQQDNGLPAWSPQTLRSFTKIDSPSNSHTPGVREIVFEVNHTKRHQGGPCCLPPANEAMLVGRPNSCSLKRGQFLGAIREIAHDASSTFADNGRKFLFWRI